MFAASARLRIDIGLQQASGWQTSEAVDRKVMTGLASR